MRSEAELLQDTLATLSRDFHVRREVRGVGLHGQHVRLDAVITPRDPSPWKNPTVALGIEAKAEGSSAPGDFQHLARWVAQCIDYSYSRWDGYGLLPIFMLPSLDMLGWPPDSRFDVIPHLLGQFNIGEVTTHPQHGLALTVHQHHRIWSEKRGVEAGKRWTLTPRIGSGRR